MASFLYSLKKDMQGKTYLSLILSDILLVPDEKPLISGNEVSYISSYQLKKEEVEAYLLASLQERAK